MNAPGRHRLLIVGVAALVVAAVAVVLFHEPAPPGTFGSYRTDGVTFYTYEPASGATTSTLVVLTGLGGDASKYVGEFTAYAERHR